MNMEVFGDLIVGAFFDNTLSMEHIDYNTLVFIQNRIMEATLDKLSDTNLMVFEAWDSIQ